MASGKFKVWGSGLNWDAIDADLMLLVYSRMDGLYPPTRVTLSNVDYHVMAQAPQSFSIFNMNLVQHWETLREKMLMKRKMWRNGKGKNEKEMRKGKGGDTGDQKTANKSPKTCVYFELVFSKGWSPQGRHHHRVRKTKEKVEKRKWERSEIL